MKLKPLHLLLFVLIVSFVHAEDASIEFSRNLIRHLDLESKVTGDDIAALAKAKSRAEHPSLTSEERKSAYKDLFDLMSRLMGSTPPPGLIDRLVQTSISWTCPDAGGKANTAFANRGELANVIKQGSGKIPLILIPDIGMDGNVFQSFLDRNKDNYTMYAVTLPGFGGTPPLREFERRDYVSLRLWKNAEDAILNLIRKENLKSPVLAGHQAGGYLALRMALDHPERIKAAVVLNGLLYAPMMSSQYPNGKMSLEVRHQIAKVFMPIELFPKPSQDCFTKYWQMIGGTMSNNPQKNLLLAQNGGKSDAHTVWNYSAELLTTDLSNEIAELKIPVLVIASIPDEKQSSNNISFSQWEEIQSKMIKVVPMKNVGTFALDDNPQQIDRTILEFVKGDEPQRH